MRSMMSSKLTLSLVSSVQKEVKAAKQSFSEVVKSNRLTNSTVPISADSIKSVAEQIVIVVEE